MQLICVCVCVCVCVPVPLSVCVRVHVPVPVCVCVCVCVAGYIIINISLIIITLLYAPQGVMYLATKYEMQTFKRLKLPFPNFSYYIVLVLTTIMNYDIYMHEYIIVLNE